MKKTMAIILALLLLFGLTACGAEPVLPEEPQEMPQEQPVEQPPAPEPVWRKQTVTTEESIRDLFDGSVTRETRVTTYTYGADGLLLETMQTLNGSLDMQITYTYDEAGNCIREDSLSGYGEASAKEYTYDASGNCLRKANVGGAVTDYVYDAEGRCIEEVTSHLSGMKDGISRTYDAQGKLLSETMQMDGVVRRTTTYTYDESGKCIQKEELDKAMDNCTTTEYTYDEKGNCHEESTWDAWGNSYRIFRTFDEKGNCLTERQNDLLDVYNTVWTYDEAGRILTETYENDQGDTWTISCAYDAAGNEISRSETNRDAYYESASETTTVWEEVLA